MIIIIYIIIITFTSVSEHWKDSSVLFKQEHSSVSFTLRIQYTETLV